MSNLTVFTFQFENESHEVRFVGTPDNPEWVRNDICKVLGIENESDATSGFDVDDLGSVEAMSGGQRRKLVTVTESGLYRLIFKSRKPAAKKFQQWVFKDILPSIRKTGTYSTNLTPCEQLLAQAQQLVEHEHRLKAIEDKLESHSERIESVEAEVGRFTNPHGNYYTIVGYASLLKIEMPHAQAVAMGRKASLVCRTLEIPIGDVRDPRFGTVHSYPESILKNLNW